MAKVGKKYAEAAKKIDRSKSYSVAEAVKLAKETNIAKFDASVEVSFKLNVDPRHADQQIRGAMVLPHGTGKTQKVCVITQGPVSYTHLDVYKRQVLEQIVLTFIRFVKQMWDLLNISAHMAKKL